MAERYKKRMFVVFQLVTKYHLGFLACIDWVNTDLSRLPCIVVGAVGKIQNHYCLRCIHELIACKMYI